MQYSLLDAPAVYPPLRKTRTSRLAARQLAPRLGERERLVLSALAVGGDMTPDEVAEFLGVCRTVVRPRCTTMAQRGWLTVTGETRPTGLGGVAEVYRLTSKGREHLGNDVGNFGHAATVRKDRTEPLQEKNGAVSHA